MIAHAAALGEKIQAEGGTMAAAELIETWMAGKPT
jgi:hypothetical protein